MVYLDIKKPWPRPYRSPLGVKFKIPTSLISLFICSYPLPDDFCFDTCFNIHSIFPKNNVENNRLPPPFKYFETGGRKSRKYVEEVFKVLSQPSFDISFVLKILKVVEAVCKDLSKLSNKQMLA